MSVKPAQIKLVGWKGGTYEKTFTLHTGDTVDSPVRDLTGYNPYLVLRNNKTKEVYMTLTVDSENILVGEAEGTISIIIPDEVTEEITWRVANFTLFLERPDGQVDPLLYGYFVMEGP